MNYDYLEGQHCVVCRKKLRHGRYNPVSINDISYKVCKECMPVLLNFEEYGLVEKPLTWIKCSKCGMKYPKKLVFFPFNFKTKHWGKYCWRCLNILHAPVSFYEQNGKRYKIKETGNQRYTSPSKLLSKYDISLEESKYLKRMYYRILKRNERKFPGTINVTLKELIEQYVDQKGWCYYTGLVYKLNGDGADDDDGGGGGGRHPLLCSVDRIDSSKGYTKENIVFCCWFVNAAKNEWGLEEIQQYWKYLPLTS